MDQKTLLSTIHSACAQGVQLIPSDILCASIGSIGLKDPLTVTLEATLRECLDILQKRKVGSLLIVDSDGKLSGMGKVNDLDAAFVRDFMTKDPVRELPDASLAFALSVMSHGGFRHVPIVDQDDIPIGIVSVKDVIDYFVQRMLDGIFESVDIDI